MWDSENRFTVFGYPPTILFPSFYLSQAKTDATKQVWEHCLVFLIPNQLIRNNKAALSSSICARNTLEWFILERGSENDKLRRNWRQGFPRRRKSTIFIETDCLFWRFPAPRTSHLKDDLFRQNFLNLKKLFFLIKLWLFRSHSYF